MAEVQWTGAGAAQAPAYLVTARQCREVAGAEDIQAGLAQPTPGCVSRMAASQQRGLDQGSSVPARALATELALPGWQLSAAMQAAEAGAITRVTAAAAEGSASGLVSRRTARAMASSGGLASNVLSTDEVQHVLPTLPSLTYVCAT